MAVHGMIDLETLSTRPDATVLTLGAIKFDPYTDSEPHAGLYLRVDVDEQSELSRHVDEGTLEWWGRQDEKIRDEALGDEDRVSLNSMVKQLNKWCVGVDTIWCQGPAFDIVILEEVCKQLKRGYPWKYWQVKDSTTKIGLISPHSHNFCESCNRVRISCKGELFLCLGHEEKVELLPLIKSNPNNDDPIIEAIKNSMKFKPESHTFDLSDNKPAVVRFMSHTGG